VSRLRGVFLDTAPLRYDRDFRLLWSGQLVSGVGRQITVVALPYQLYVLTGSPLAVGLLAAVQLIPLLTVSFVGGALADAVDRRRLLLITQASLAVTSGALALLSLSPQPPIVLLYVVAFVTSAIGAFDQPARASLLPRLVARERLAAAIALNQGGYQLAAIAGPAVGGLLIATVGLSTAYLIDALTFGASILAVCLIRPVSMQQGARRVGPAAILEGLRFARRHRVVLGTFVIDLDAMIFGMPTALFPVLALDVFRMGPAGVGLLAAAPAVGALIGALLTGWIGRVRRQGVAVFAAVAVWGIAITLFGLVTASFALALVFLAIAGAADVVSAVMRSTIVQMATPDALRGRLTGLHITVVNGGPRLGDMEASAVAAATSAQFSVVSGGLLCLAGLVLVAWRFPELARYDSTRPEASMPPGLSPHPLGGDP
jgi:MFS family permease